MYQTKNLYQNDDQWKSVPLGNQTKETIGTWGCLMTCITMVLNGSGFTETPATVNEKMKKAGGFMEALLVPAYVPIAFPGVVYKLFEPCEAVPAPLDRIDAAVAAGKPVILQVDWNPAAGIQTHYVLVKEKKGSDYSLYDPYKYKGDGPDKEVLLTQRYKYQGKDLAKAISGIFWFEGKGQPVTPPPAKEKLPIPSPKFTLYAEADLALRGEPAVTGYLYKRFAENTLLTSLEPKDKAQAKIGQSNQWLQVQDPDGEQGYVAAWFTSAKKIEAPAPTPVPTPTPTPTPTPAPIPAGAMVLSPTQDGLMLRSKPLVGADTALRMLPLSEKLVVVETAAQAAAKVGKQDQWIQVKDGTGQQGYVAAWYVTVVSGAPAGGTQPPAGLVVRTTTEDVSLRNQPLVSDTTLIKRMPLGTLLTVTETGGEAKIGQNNQWLKVKDPSGVEGYVAAWYVAK